MKLEVIDDDDELYRRLAPDFVKRDGSISSAAFKRNGVPDPELSVDLARLTTPEQSLVTRPNFGLGGLLARVPRQIGLNVRHDPVEGNQAHSVIEGQTTREQPRLLAEQTRIIRLPS